MPYIRLELPLNVPSAYCKQDSGFACNRSSSSESSGEVKGESLYSDLASQDAESEFDVTNCQIRRPEAENKGKCSGTVFVGVWCIWKASSGADTEKIDNGRILGGLRDI